MSEWHFVRPLWLLLLPVLPLLVLVYRRRRLDGGRWRDYVDPALAPFVLTGAGDQRGGKFASLLVTLVAALLIVALAGPVRERLPQPVYRSEAALVIALDLSRSMNARDVLPSRLERARLKIRDLLARRVEGETALVAFAGDAFPVTPLTDDTETIAALLGSLTTDIVPRQGSLLTPALARAQRLLEQAGATRGHVLLVTDGVADRDEAVTAATTLASQDITVSVLAVGTRDGDVVRDADGDLVKDRRGQIVVAGLDVPALAAVSSAGNGRIVTLSVDDADVDALLASAEDLLPGGRMRDDMQADVWKEEGALLVLLCLPLVALAFRRGWIACVAAVCLLPPPPSASAGGWNDLWTRRDLQAQREFEQEDYAEAAELFEDPRWRAAAAYRSGDFDQSAAALAGLDDAEAHYNRGNALARGGDIEGALAAYRAALERDPQHEDARHNLDLLEQMQQQNQQQEQNSSQDGEQQDQQDQQSQSADNDGSQSDGEDGSGGEQSSETGESSSAQNDPQDGDASQQQTEAEQGEQEGEEQTAAEAQAEQDAQDEASREMAQALGDGEQERDFAAEQWLNQVPDDPGGLLRRKFARQYQQRYQDQPKEEQEW